MENQKETAKANLGKMIKSASQIGIALAKLGIQAYISSKTDGNIDLGEIFGDAVTSVLETGKDTIEDVLTSSEVKKLDNFFVDYQQYLSAVEEIKKILKEIAKNKPIIIIIDELDRCKPLFAIQLLETVKHILDVENVTFVFALDIKQLSCSIKCVYGQEMDALGYLTRFFDYISKLPQANLRKYIDSLVEQKPLIKNDLTFLLKNNNVKYNIRFEEVFEDFAIKLNLSLRDINTIYSNFLILEKFQLKHTTSGNAYSLYLFLLILKYKFSNVFESIFVRGDYHVNEQNEIFNFESSYLEKNTFITIKSNELLSKKELIAKSDISNEIIKILGVDNLKIKYIKGIHTYTFDLELSSNLSDCIFYDDLLKWEKIKNKSIRMYIQENLEFFDFSYE